MQKQRHPKYTQSFVDSCAFNPNDEQELASIQRLLSKCDEYGIALIIPFSVQKELNHPNTPNDVRRSSIPHIFTIDTELTAAELSKRSKIRKLIRGNAKLGKHEQDANHIFELYKYGGGYFITTDKRLLSKSKDLFLKYFVTTIKPTDFEAMLNSD